MKCLEFWDSFYFSRKYSSLSQISSREYPPGNILLGLSSREYLPRIILPGLSSREYPPENILLGISESFPTGNEAQIYWNCNPLGTKSLDRLFGRWNSVTVANKEDYTVLQRPLPPFYRTCREFYIFTIPLFFGNFSMSNLYDPALHGSSIL